MLKKIGIAVGALVGLLLIVVATRPADFTVQRSAVIAAPAATVHALVNDFHRWADWSPWDKMDPAMKKTIEGPPSGPGAKYAWSGNDKVGEGRMTIVDSRPGASVEIKLEFLKPFAATNQTIFTFQPEGTGTRVQWTMNGHNDFMGKAFTLFMDMDGMVGPDFEKGLASMKGLAEGEAKRRAAEEARRAAEEAERKAAEAAAAAARDGGTK